MNFQNPFNRWSVHLGIPRMPILIPIKGFPLNSKKTKKLQNQNWDSILASILPIKSKRTRQNTCKKKENPISPQSLHFWKNFRDIWPISPSTLHGKRTKKNGGGVTKTLLKVARNIQNVGWEVHSIHSLLSEADKIVPLFFAKLWPRS